MLNAKLTQLRGPRDAGAIGKGKRYAPLFKHGNDDGHALLLFDGKTVPPGLKLLSNDDLARHTESIPFNDYSVKGLTLLWTDRCKVVA